MQMYSIICTLWKGRGLFLKGGEHIYYSLFISVDLKMKVCRQTFDVTANNFVALKLVFYLHIAFPSKDTQNNNLESKFCQIFKMKL